LGLATMREDRKTAGDGHVTAPRHVSRIARIAFLSGIFVTGLLAATSANAVTLREELLYLLDGHPQLKAGQDNVEAADEAIGRAEAVYLPVVSLTGDNGYKEINGPAQRSASNIWRRGFEQYGLSVTQNLYDASRKDFDKDAAELNRELVKGTLAETRNNLLFQAANAYVDVLRQSRLVRLARKSEATIAEQLSLEDERVKRGGGTAVDVLLAKTRLQRSKEQRIIFEGALRDSYTRYTNVFGRPPILEEMEDSTLRMDLVPENIDGGITLALATNPIVNSSNKQIDIARSRQRSATTEYFPRLDMVGAANWEDNREGTVGSRRDWSVTLQATWNLFSGFSTRATVAEAAHGYSSSINNHLFANRRVEEELRLAWQAMMTACKRRLLLDNATIIAGEVHSSRVKLQDNGQETVINVLDAESELFSAEINLAGAGYDEKLAIYRLAVAMGHSLADALIEPEETAARAEAETRYIQRCEDSLKTVALPAESETEQPDAANPFAAPAADDSEASDDDSATATEAEDPFAKPAGDEESDDEPAAANPFDKTEDEDEDKEEESGAANPFDKPSEEPASEDQSAVPAKPTTDLISSLDDTDDAEAVTEAEIKGLKVQDIPAALALVLNSVDDEIEPGPSLINTVPQKGRIDWDDDESVTPLSAVN